MVRIRVLGQEGNIRANLVLFEGFWIVEFKFQMKETWANLGLFEEGGERGAEFKQGHCSIWCYYWMKPYT